MSPHRIVAVVLFVIAFLTLAASRAFPFLADLSGAVKTAIVVFGAICVLAGVRLWSRNMPDPKE